MSGFSAAWLGLREAADHAARSEALSVQLSHHLAHSTGVRSPAGPLRVVDLATGTGSNPRYLFRHLPSRQEWTLLDADPQLLAELPTRMAAWATRAGWACVQGRDGVVVTSRSAELRVRPRQADISRFPIAAFGESPALITASALLDLVSDAWLAALVAACRDLNAAVLFALTYDGRTTLSPSRPGDDLILRLVNRHQMGDKGFGLALGPDATSKAAAHFERAGYDVRRAASDWTIRGAERTLQQELIAGWAQAACEVQPEDADGIRGWERERMEAAAAGELIIVVGHEDLVAWPRT
jgi:hypothetical protein